MDQQLHVFTTRPELNRAVAEAIVVLAQRTASERGAFHIVLAGGNTPRDVYACLAEAPLCDEMPWQKTHVYFGDERTVAPQDEQSNYGMARAALLGKVPIPTRQIHRMQGEDKNPVEAAARYERVIRACAPINDNWPCFDLILLGVGTDGHIASLFPDTLAVQERNRVVTAVYVPTMNTWRITVTLPVIIGAKHVFVVTAGAEKSAIIKQALDMQADAHYPVQQIRAARHADWFLDAAAASQLTDITTATLRR